MPLSTGAIALDGLWDLTLSSGAHAVVEVPGTWTTQIPGHDFSAEQATYRRRFVLPDVVDAAHCAVIFFGGVNYSAEVRLNGHVLGSHVGGWTPFEMDMTDQLVRGANDLEVIVDYPTQNATADGPALAEVPHGKQSWYGSAAGMWQSVRLEIRPRQHIADLVVRPHGASGTLSGRMRLARPWAEGNTISVTVADLGSTASPQRWEVHGTAGDDDVEWEVTIENPLLWSPQTPHRYRVAATVHSADGDHTVDAVTGFRDIATRDGDIVLNGYPLEIRGVLDQDYHPGSATIPESDEALRSLFAEVKRLGFNTLRCHIKRPDSRYYELADEMGLLVWAELPNWSRMTDRAAADGLALLRELIDLDGHHPSVIIWTIMNESWGIDLRDEGQRQWLIDAFRTVKEWTPHTLVVDNSACAPNFHLVSDLDDYHVYRSIPEGRRDWDATIADFAARPDWTYSPHGDAVRSREEPLVLSEYGNWGLPHAIDQFDENGREPWWFATGAHWAFGVAEGTGLMRRFAELSLDRVFGSWEAFIAELQTAQMAANRYQTGSIRQQESLSGYVLTQLSDVQWEANGLFDMQRTPKHGLDDFGLVNGEEAVVIRPSRYSATTADVLEVAVHVITPRPGGPVASREYELSLSVAGVVVHREVIPGTARTSTTRAVRLPTSAGATEVAAELRVSETLVARDAATVIVLADEVPVLGRSVQAADAEVATWLSHLGVPAAEGPLLDDSVLVSRRFDDSAQRHARGGGRVLVLAEEADALADAFNHLPLASLELRAGDGDWVPRLDWLRREGALAAIPGSPLLGIPFEDLLGPWVIRGIPAPLRPAVVHSGVFSGWLRHDAATSVTVPWSSGEVTITTLRMRADGPRDDLRVAVGRAFLAHAARR